MTNYVVDTNVWVTMDKPIAEVQTLEEIDCIAACSKWIGDFVTSTDRLVLDDQHKILREYRNNIKQQGRAYQLLSRLETQPREEHLIELPIEFDEDGYAILPDSITFHDPSDRKFIAVALQFTPPAPIVNATDTDWAVEKASLSSTGITVQELCPGYIEVVLKE